MFRCTEKSMLLNLLYVTLKEATSSRIYSGMKEEEAGRSFSRIHESLKSAATLRLIFGAAVVKTIVATPQNRVFSYSTRPSSLSRVISSPIISTSFPFSSFHMQPRDRRVARWLKLNPSWYPPKFFSQRVRVHSCHPVRFVHHPPELPSIFLHCDAANASWINPNSNKLFIREISYCIYYFHLLFTFPLG